LLKFHILLQNKASVAAYWWALVYFTAPGQANGDSWETLLLIAATADAAADDAYKAERTPTDQPHKCIHRDWSNINQTGQKPEVKVLRV